MNNDFYNFKIPPFSETPNTHFYFAAENHSSNLKSLREHIEQGCGFISLTAEVGTGKTMMARYLIKEKNENMKTAYLFWPNLEGDALIEKIALEFGIQKRYADYQGLERFLLKNAKEGNRCVLFIDEAQNLSLKSLETIRLISNIESETKKIIQIVFMGQPEFNDVLAQNEARQINQRISVHLQLSPLPFEEAEMYIKYRLEMARGGGFVRFDYEAMKLIYEFTKGVPRLINLFCRTILIYGAHKEIRMITEGVAREALELSKLIPRKRKYKFWQNSGIWARR